MKPLRRSFDRLARGYRVLEFVAFGRDLERARFCFLEELRDCRSLLVLGEGDGRCLARLVRLAPEARIHCVDSSGAMLALASSRLAGTGCAERVVFELADAFALGLPPAHYDAVVTFFFFDCFPAGQVSLLVERLRPSLRPGARWLWADFALPPAGWARWRARVWVAVLYAFFRWQTGLPARELPPTESILERSGLRREGVRDFQQGLVRSAWYTAPR
jgi:ubiquinone/menaquinone biosynthesis C-methylase UbiE